MKKVVTALLAIAMLAGTSAYAAWDFDVETITTGDFINSIGGGLVSVGENADYKFVDYKGNTWTSASEKFDDSTEYILNPLGYEYQQLPKEYTYVKKIDNNEYIVQDGKNINHLTAKGIIGEALYTDIKININGSVMPCYSVNDYVMIKAEDLRGYGFKVDWNPTDKMLYITRDYENNKITEAANYDTGKPGTFFSYIYGTDINADFFGKRINSYSINGELLIMPEESLRLRGITFDYNDAERMLYMHVDGLEQK